MTPLLSQARHRIGVAIGDWVLDLSVAAPVFFTGPELSKSLQVDVWTVCTIGSNTGAVYIIPMDLGISRVNIEWVHVSGPSCMDRGQTSASTYPLQGRGNDDYIVTSTVSIASSPSHVVALILQGVLRDNVELRKR